MLTMLRTLYPIQREKLLDLPVNKFLSVLLLIAFLSLTYSKPLLSATWSGSSGVTLQLGVVQRSMEGQGSAERASSASIEPFYSFSRVSRAQTINGRVGVQHQRFSDGGGQTTEPRLFLNSRTTMVENRFWLNTHADASRRIIGNAGFSDDTPTSEDQATSAVSWQIIPEFRYRPSVNVIFGSKAGISRSRSSVDSDFRDISSAAVQGSMLWALGRRGHLVALDSRFQKTEFKSGEKIAFGTIAVGADIPLYSQMAGYAKLGYDWVSFDGQENELSDVEQDKYVVGLRWRPNRLFELNAEYAKSVYGHQPTVSMSIARLRSQFEFRWTKGLQIEQFIDTRLQNLSVIGVDTDEVEEENGTGGSEAEFNCTEIGQIGCVLVPFVTDSRTVEEAIYASYTLTGRVSSISFSVSRTELTELDAHSNTRNRNAARVSFSRSLSRNFRVTISGRVYKTRVAGENSTPDSFTESVLASVTWVSK